MRWEVEDSISRLSSRAEDSVQLTVMCICDCHLCLAPFTSCAFLKILLLIDQM